MGIATNALITLAEMNRYLKLEENEINNDRLENIIDEVSQHCEEYCRRHFITETKTDERYNGDGTTELVLRSYPIISVASITPYKDATALTVRVTEFEYDDRSGIVTLLGGRVFPTSFQEVKITYDSGFGARAELPADIKLATKIAVATRFKEMQKGSYSVTRQDAGGEGGSTEYIETIYPLIVLNIWDARRVHVYA